MVKFQSRKWVLITNKVHVMSSRINWSGSSCFYNSTQSSSPRTIFHPSLLVDRRIFPTQIHFAFVWLAVEDDCSNIFLCWIRLYHYTVEAIHGHKGVLQETIRHFILIAIKSKFPGLLNMIYQYFTLKMFKCVGVLYGNLDQPSKLKPNKTFFPKIICLCQKCLESNHILLKTCTFAPFDGFFKKC